MEGAQCAANRNAAIQPQHCVVSVKRPGLPAAEVIAAVHAKRNLPLLGERLDEYKLTASWAVRPLAASAPASLCEADELTCIGSEAWPEGLQSEAWAFRPSAASDGSRFVTARLR
jgi:hypothetical protein